MLNYPKLTCYNLIIRRQVTFIIIIIIIIIVIRLIMTIIMTMIMLMIMIMIMTGSLWMLISFYGIRWQASESFMRPNGDLHALLDLGGSTSWSWWYHFLCRQYLYHFSIRFRWMSLIFMSTISMGGSPHLCGVYLQNIPLLHWGEVTLQEQQGGSHYLCLTRFLEDMG